MTTHSPPPAATGDPGSPEVERQYHDYVSNDIPWYVRLIWIGFWIFAAAIVLGYLIPALRVELVNPP